MTPKNETLIIAYPEMMNSHLPSPTTGDCSDEILVSEYLRERFKLRDLAPTSSMYDAYVPLVSQLRGDDSHILTECT